MLFLVPLGSHQTSPFVATVGSSGPGGAPDYFQIARSFAARNGDSNPDSLSYVSTDRNSALILTSGDVVSDPRPVKLVQMHGNFVGYSAKVPPRASLPKGSWITLTEDASTGQILDWDLVNTSVDLQKLGSVTNG